MLRLTLRAAANFYNYGPCVLGPRVLRLSLRAAAKLYNSLRDSNSMNSTSKGYYLRHTPVGAGAIFRDRSGVLLDTCSSRMHVRHELRQ